MDSEDASILQYSKTLDSLQSKLNQISNSFQQFYMSIANGPVIGGILDFLNSLISGFNKLGTIDSVATIINIVRGIKTALQTALTAGSPLFSTILTQFKTTMSQVVAIARKSGAEARENFDAGYNGTATLTGGVGGTATPKTGVELSKKAKAGMLGATIGGSALALIGTTVTGNGNARLGSALTMGGNILSYGAQGAMMGAQAGPKGLVIGAILGSVIGGITSLGSVISSFSNTLQEEIDNLKQETEDSNIERVEAKTKADDLADYIDKWTELKAHQHDSTEAMQEYLDVSNEIAEVYPEYVSYIDESGNAIINMSSATQDLTIALEAASGKTVEWANNALKLAKKEADQAWQKVGHDDSYFATTDGSNWKTARTGIGRSYETTGTEFKLTDIAFGAVGIDDVIQAWKQIGTKPWEHENDPENSLGYPVNKIIESILEVNKSDPLDADTIWGKYEELKKSGASPEEYKNTFLELFGFKSLGEFNTALETLNTEIDQLPEGSQKYQQAILTRAMLTTYGQGFLGNSFINDDYTMGSAYYNAMIADNNLSQTLQSTGSTLFSSGYNAWLNEQGGKNSQAGLEADKYGYKALISYQALHDDKLGTTVFSTQLSSGEYMEQWYEVYSSLITQLDNDASLILQNFADSPTSISMSDIDSLASEASNNLTSEQETALKNILDMWRSETGGLYESLASHMIAPETFKSYDEWIKEQEENADTSYQEYWQQTDYAGVYSKISSLAPSLVSQITNTLTELDDLLNIDEGEADISGTAAYKAAEVRKKGILALLDPSSIVSKIADPEKRQAVWDAILAEQSVDWQDNIIQALKDAGVNETAAQSIFGEGGALTGASFVNLNTAINNYYNKIADQNEAIVDILENGAKGLDIDTAKKKWSELGIKDTDFSEAFEWNDEAGGLILSQTGQDRVMQELDNTITKYETAQAAVKAAQEKFNNDSSGVDWGASTTTTFDDGSERQVASWWQRLGLTQDDELYKTLNDAIITGRAEGKTVEAILSETLSDLANSTDEKVIEWYKKYAEEVKEEFERTNAASDIKSKTSNFAKEYTDAFDDDYLKMLEEQYELKKNANGKYTSFGIATASAKAGYYYNYATGELTRLPSAIKASMGKYWEKSDQYRALATDYEAASNSILEKVLGFSGIISAADREYLNVFGINISEGTEWTEDNLNYVLEQLHGSKNLSDADYSKGLGQVRHNALTLQDTYNQAVESLFSNIGTATLEDVTSFIEKVAPGTTLDNNKQDGLKKALKQGGEALWKYLTEDLELNIKSAESVYKASMNAGKAEAMSSITGLYDTFQDETLSAEEKVKEILSVFEMVGGLDDVDYDALMANVKEENWTAIIAQLLESFRTMFNGVITNQDWSDIAADFKEKMTDTLIGMNEKIINAYSGLTTGKTLAEAQQELKDLGLEGEIGLNKAYTWSDAQTGFVGTSALYTKLQEKQQAEANAEAAKKVMGEQAVALEGRWGAAASPVEYGQLPPDGSLFEDRAFLSQLTPENYLNNLGINQTDWSQAQKDDLATQVKGKSGRELFETVLNYLTQLSETYNEGVQQMLQDQTDYYAEQAQLAVQTLGASNQLSMQQSALQGYSSLTDTNFVKYLKDSKALEAKNDDDSYTLDELATAAKEKGYLFNEATGELITTPEAIKNQVLDAYNSTVDESSQITDVNQLTGQWAAQYAASMAAWRSNFFDTLMGYEGEVTEEQVAYLESIGLTYLHAGDKWTQLAKDAYITTAAGKGYLTSNQAEAGHRKNALDNNTHDIAKAAKKTQESFWNDYTDLTVADINTFYQEIEDTTQNLTTDQQNLAAEVLRKGGYDELYAFLTSAGDYENSGLGLTLDNDIFDAGKTDAMASTLEDIGDLGETLADTNMEDAEKVAEVMEIFEQLGELPEGIDVKTITDYITSQNWDGLWAALEQAFIKMFGEAESAQFQSAQEESNAKQIDKERENIEEIVSLVGDAVDGTLEAEKVLKVEKLYGNAGVQSYNMSGVTYTQTATGMQMSEDDALKAMAALAAAQPMYMDTILSSMQENGLLDNYTLIVALINEAKGGTERWGDATADVVKLLGQAKQDLEQDVNNSSLEASLMGESDDKFSNFLGQVSDYSTLLTQVSKGQRISYESGEKLFSVYASNRGWDLKTTTDMFEKWGEAVAATADMTDGGSIDFGAGLTAIGTSVTEFGETFAKDLRNFAQNRVDYLDGLIALLEGMDELQNAFKEADDIKLPGFTYDDSKSPAENYQNAMAGLDNNLDWQRDTFKGKTWKEASGGLIPISQLLFGVAGVTADNFNAETYQQIIDRQEGIYNLLSQAMSKVDPQQYIDENDNLNESAYLAALIKQYQDLAKVAAEAAREQAKNKNKTDEEAQEAYDNELNKYQVDGAQYNTSTSTDEKAGSGNEIKITADTDPATAAYEQFKNTVTSSPVQLNVNVPTTKLKGQIDQAIQYAKSQSVTLNVSVGRSSATGKASVTGNAYAEGTPSLVGELGPELAVYDNQYHILGQNGAEFVNLPHNAIIFNHKQTAGILNGRPGARGRVLDGGEAFVAGTGPAYAGNYDAAINALKRERSLWQGILSSLSFEDLIGSGGGGGGSNTIQATIQELTEWYNLTRQIRDLEIQINNLEAERENITDGHKYLRNLRETQELLQAQMITQKTLLDYQEKQLDQQKEQINENEIWNKFFTVDDDGLLQYVMGNETNGGKGTLSVLDQMNKMSGEEQVAFLKKIGYTYTDNDGKEYKDAELVQKFYEEAQTQIDKYDDLRDTVAETTETLEDLEGEINSINEEIRENQETLEQDVYDALVNKMETEIEDLTDQMELLKEANDAYINGLSDALQKERDLYSENQSTADREQLQRELSLLRRSGGSASKIASLEEQLDSTLQDEYFTHQQDTIDSIQEASDKQVEALNKQIELQQESLDYQKEAGVLWTKVYEIMAQNEEEIMDFLRGNSEGFYEKSQLAQEDALKEWSKEVGIYKEDSIWGREFNAKMAEGEFDSTAWTDADEGAEKKEIYDSLNTERQADIQKLFGEAYANAKAEGKDRLHSLAAAQQAIYERLYASIGEDDGSGTGSSGSGGSSKTNGDPSKGWVHISYGVGLSGTTSLAVGGKGYYRITDKTIEEVYASNNCITLRGKRIIANKRGSVTIYGKRKIDITSDTVTAATGALIEEDETPAILHKGEGVFTAKQTSALISMVDNYQKLATNAMGATLLSSFAGTAKNYSSLSAAPSNQTSSITIDPGAVVIQVEKLNDKYDVDSLATDVFNKITAIASKATNRGVNRR